MSVPNAPPRGFLSGNVASLVSGNPASIWSGVRNLIGPGGLSAAVAARVVAEQQPQQQVSQPPLRVQLSSYRSLQGYLDSCPRELTSLELHNAKITTKSLRFVRFPPGLKELNLEQNQITSLEGVQFPPGLTELILNDNQIWSLSSVKFPRGLKRLELNNNKMQSLSGTEFPPNLERLDLEGNPLRDLGYVDEGDDGRYTRLINPNKYVIDYLKRNFAQLHFRDLYDHHKESKTAEKSALKAARQSQKAASKAARQSQKATLKKMTDLSQHSMQIQLRAVTSFLREGMAARAQQHADQMLRDKQDKPTTYEESLFYAKLGEKTYPIPMNEELLVQDVLDYLNEHYYISVLHDCGDMHLHKPGVGNLDSGRTLKDCGVVSEEALELVCGTRTHQGGFARHRHSIKRNKQSQPRRNKSKSKSKPKKNGHGRN
jgi:hypothetical protein